MSIFGKLEKLFGRKKSMLILTIVNIYVLAIWQIIGLLTGLKGISFIIFAVFCQFSFSYVVIKRIVEYYEKPKKKRKHFYINAKNEIS